MTGLAVRHAEVDRHTLGGIVALHTIHHVGQAQIREAGASGNGIVTGGAIDVELLFRREMRDVSKFDVDVSTRNRCLGYQAAILSKARVFDFLGCVTTGTTFGVKRGRQLGRNAELGMAGGALGVAWKLRKNALLIELMAESAIPAEAGCWIFPALLIYVPVMGKLEQECPLSPVARKGQQIGLAARGGGRVAHPAQRRPRLCVIIVEVVRVTGHALIVTGTLELHRSILDCGVAQGAL